MLASVVWVGLGGMLGAVTRYGVSQAVAARWGTSFPLGTLLINVSGSFAIGVVMTILVSRNLDPAWRAFVVIGFLGGYTTFSSFALELVALLEAGHIGGAGIYLIASNLLGVLACIGGVVLARAMLA